MSFPIIILNGGEGAASKMNNDRFTFVSTLTRTAGYHSTIIVVEKAAVTSRHPPDKAPAVFEGADVESKTAGASRKPFSLALSALEKGFVLLSSRLFKN